MDKNKLFSEDSEIAVLSLLLKNPDLIHSIDGLKSGMFSSIPRMVIFQQIEELTDRGQTFDPSLVYESLASKNEIEKIGGRRGYDSILSRDFPIETFQEFVTLVVASYKARAYLSITSGVDKSQLNASNVDEKIYETRKDLENLMEIRGSGELIRIGDLTRPAFDVIASRLGKPGIQGYSWGNKEFDLATGGKVGGDLWILGGRPGQGKTTLILNSILTDGLNGIPSLIIEREMRNQALLERMIGIQTGIANEKIQQGILNEKELDRVREGLEAMKNLPIFIDSNFRANNHTYLEATINKYKNKYDIKSVYVDYLQLLTERDETQTQEIGRLSRMFKLLANDLDICSILISQLNREVERRDNKRPLMSDLRQSGALEEDSDFVVGLYRDEYYNGNESKLKNIMELIILKNRNGPTGTAMTRFDGPTYKISER